MSAEHRVELYVYDLTKGMARAMSPSLLGKQIDGVWHTGIVVYGKEYFFGSMGIEFCAPCGTILGEPLKKEFMGETQIPEEVFEEYINGLRESAFAGGSYDLLKHNCNHFSNEVSQFLCGHEIPDYIIKLVDEVMSTPLGQSLLPMLASMSVTAMDPMNAGRPHNN